MKNNQQNWNNYFRDIGLPVDIVRQYDAYIESCYQKNIPPIFEDNHMSLLMGRDIKLLRSYIHGTDEFYRTFKIKKRSGGFREISTPYPSLLECQKWISNNILKSIDMPKYVTGYRKGMSILDNAKIHCGRDYLLKIDIQNFFPSISFSRIINVFKKLGYPANVSFVLAGICCHNRRLPQGGAASPSLSNVICLEMDKKFYEVCKKNGLRYTRYSDDITVSGKRIPRSIIRYFFELIENYGFSVNKEKLRLIPPGHRKIVTGLDITHGYPRVSREFRRELMKDIYFVWSVGLQAHVARERIFEPSYIEQLIGRVGFWRLVEPNNVQMKKASDRLSSVVDNI